jgi:hypothetical protein
MNVPKIKIGNWLILGANTIGMTLYPFIFLKKSYFAVKPKEVLDKCIRHESIHIQQQKELLVVFFYVWYITEYLIRFLTSLRPNVAYENISFEREAYTNENDENYLANRTRWRFLHYIFNKQ